MSLLFLILLFSPLQDVNLEVNVKECFEYKFYGSPYNVYTLEITNHSPVTLSKLEIEISQPVEVSPAVIFKDVVLSPGGKKRFFVYELYQGARFHSSIKYIKIRSGPRELFSQKFNIMQNLVYKDKWDSQKKVMKKRHLVGILSGKDRWGLNIKTHYEHIFYIDEELVPDRWQGLIDLRAIVIYDAQFEVLNAQQRQAIIDYVMAGGIVIIIPTLRRDYYKSEFLQALYPITAEITADNTFEIHGGKEVLEGEAYIFEKGSGKIVAFCRMPDDLAFSLSSDELNKLFDETPFPVGGIDEVSRLKTLPTGFKLRFPSIVFVGVVLGIYIFALIFLISYLRKKGLMVWNIIVIPALSLIFVLVVITGGYLYKGLGTTISGYSITFLSSGAEAGATIDVVTFYSSSARRYHLARVDTLGIVGFGLPCLVKDTLIFNPIDVKQWVDDKSIFLRLSNLGGHIWIKKQEDKWHIDNDTQFHFKQVAFYEPAKFIFLGEIPPMHKKTISLNEATIVSTGDREALIKFLGNFRDAEVWHGLTSFRDKYVWDGFTSSRPLIYGPEIAWSRYTIVQPGSYILLSYSQQEFLTLDGSIKIPFTDFWVVRP